MLIIMRKLIMGGTPFRHVGMFKVGKELFTAVGPKIIESIKKEARGYF